ncbi:MAG: hypothetical protein WAV82_15460, partial [Methylobacter sp.]
TGTMKPLAREGKTARRFQPLPAWGGWGVRLNSKTNLSELLINLVKFIKPKMLTGLNQPARQDFSRKLKWDPDQGDTEMLFVN